jgi:iron(III) transport system permease protein
MIGGWAVVWNTVVLVVATAVLSVAASFMISWVVVRTHVRVRGLMDVLAMLPHAIPGLAFAFALVIIAILASRWVPDVPLKGTIAIIVLANLISRVAYGTRISNAALLQVGLDLEEAATVCGAHGLAAIRRILVPLVRPALLYAALWTAMLTFREVSMALLLQEPDNIVLSTRVWIMWRQGQATEASAAAVVMIVVLSVLVLLVQLLAGGRSREQAAPSAVP